MDEHPTLFVWRGYLDSRDEHVVEWQDKSVCLFCGVVVNPIRRSFDGEGTNWGPFKDEAVCAEYRCPKCGWWQGEWTSWHEGTFIGSEKWKTQSVLREFLLSSKELALSELGTYLRVNFEKVLHLAPRRFEELVAAVFKEHGWAVELTKQTADGGKDIVMARTSSGERAIVECKRYTNKVSVDKVDRLIGVQLVEGVKKAYFVTSSAYTRPALERQYSASLHEHGFSIELKDGNDLLNMLQCFNDLLPPQARSLETLRSKRRS